MIAAISGSKENIYGSDTLLRKTKIVGSMLGAEIDFLIKGIDTKTRSIVASRVEAMRKKARTFYITADRSGKPKIYEGRIVQARIIAVTQNSIRIEVFGVEYPILAKDISSEWIGDVREKYSIGDEILAKIKKINIDSAGDISIIADVKGLTPDKSKENLKRCRVQGKYLGKITNIDMGIIFIRLGIGVNAVAHTCEDPKEPGKKDEVSFSVSKIDEERSVAVGKITKILRQNL